MDQLLTRDSLTTNILVILSISYVIYNLIQKVLLYQQQRTFAKQNNCLPCVSYPRKDPFYGLDFFVNTIRAGRNGKFLETTQKRFESLGVYTYVSNPLGITTINTADPENIKTVLATAFKDYELFSRRKAGLMPIFGPGIFAVDGEEWEHSRAMLRPNFVRSQVADLHVFEKHFGKLIKRIPRNGATFDLSKLFFMLTIDSATEFLFGESTETLDEEKLNSPGHKYSEAYDYMAEKVGAQIRLGKPANFPRDKKYTDSIKYVHSYVRTYVDKALALQITNSSQKPQESGSDRYIFLQELAKSGYSALKIQAELLNILLAGRDTTASLLTLLFMVLSREKDVLEKLRKEVMGLEGRRPTFEEVKDMKYLRWCINETMRLYPIVSTTSRVAARDTVLPRGGGTDGKSPTMVKKGSVVVYSSYVMHRRKDIYGEDAAEFRPERWEKLRVGWEYIPFSGGPRICIGQQFALTEASYTTIRLLQTFSRIESRDDEPFAEWLTLTLSNKGGCKVAMFE
ncbi:8d5297c9-8388-451d-a4a1-d950d110eaa0 [Sclerotinia trifoliorum]|uniref:8d5297c9-8388-451d-a4a1-d950d110eaa0 n=1 Tax=Sclerotinia trifoliorum TaxID=28548 RepID=A0A8H2VTB3_9HELO|nr:8d5297c9-8388-451d-a4a1-d950d110eaa0 [Sclerotinia trifoliorum]